MEDDIGKIIHDLRIAKGMTLEEVGDLVGVGKSTVRKWETGMIANMKRDKVAKLARALGISSKILMEWDDDTLQTTSSEDIESALKLYEQYKNAIPQVQNAVDALLKPSQPDS